MTMLLRLTFYLLIFILTGLSAVPQLSAAPAKDGTNFTIAYIAGRKYYRAYDIARYYRTPVLEPLLRVMGIRQIFHFFYFF